jgi:galactoside O-acetyltransferase
MAFLTKEELRKIGFKSLGNNVLISDKASIYNASKISIGSNVRIDDFCILSAGGEGIEIGNHIHIACYTSLIGNGKITINDFANLSSRVAIYSSNDDYSGEWMTNPMIPEKFTNVFCAPVQIGKHVIIGSGTLILPNCNIGDGVAIGALSLVKTNCEENFIYAGNPVKKIRPRHQGYITLEEEFKKHIDSSGI